MARRSTNRPLSRLPQLLGARTPQVALVLSGALALYACGESDSTSSEHAASGGQAGNNEAGNGNGDAGAENGSGGTKSGAGGAHNGDGGTGLGGEGRGGDGLGGGSSTPDCGNGDLDDGESCDEGQDNSDAPNAACRTNCQLSRCGDGIVDTDTEACDKGASNSDSVHGACNTTCKSFVCAPAPDLDHDGDGFTGADGDCNDCNPNVNPQALDVDNQDELGMSLPEADQIDENCDGSIVPDDMPCDEPAAPLNSDDATAAAKAMDICHSVAENGFGLVNAVWVQVNGTPMPATAAAGLGHGLLDEFGPNVSPRAGIQMLALSSGAARSETDGGYVADPNGLDKDYDSTYPTGLPYESPACPGVRSGLPHDSVALRVTLKAPSNATGYSFQSKFYTTEFPEWICSKYNDVAFGLMSPQPAGSQDGHILFDSQGNLLTVNAGFLDVCSPKKVGDRDFACPQGTSELTGTGYSDHAATSWLTTEVPVLGGEQITLTLGVLDAEDGILDSTLLLDNFHWIVRSGVVLGTEPTSD